MNVCFVSLHAYPLFNPIIRSHFGGAEVRSSLFARGLSEHPGFHVHFVVYDHGQPKTEIRSNVCVHASIPVLAVDPPVVQNIMGPASQCGRRHQKFPWFEIHKWKPSLLWEVPAVAGCLVYRSLRPRLHRKSFKLLLSRIDSDAYFCFGASRISADVVAFCKRFKKISVLFIAHEYDLTFASSSNLRMKNIYGDSVESCHYAVSQADHIVVQSIDQAQLLRNAFARESSLIRNPIDLKFDGRIPVRPERSFVLWIGRTDPLKRPDRLLALASQCQQVPFVMILSRTNDSLYDELKQKAPPNVQIIERVPYHEIDHYFTRAALFVNTSDGEGFPNVFLQAGKHGIPILSFCVDPDGFINRHHCGYVASGNMEKMAEVLTQIWSNRQVAEGYAKALRSYVESHHSLEGRISELATLLKEISMKPAYHRPL